MKYTNHFDEVEGYTQFTFWDEVKFWSLVVLVFLAVVAVIGEITGLVDVFFNWLGV